MDDSPDYKSYSLEQLYDVAQHINREKYPERFALISKEINIKEGKRAISSPVSQEEQAMRGGCIGGCAFVIIGSVIGILIGFFCLSLFTPTPAPNMDGLNRWGGHVAAVMFGTFFGIVAGCFAAVSKDPVKAVGITTAIFIMIMLFLSS